MRNYTKNIFLFASIFFALSTFFIHPVHAIEFGGLGGRPANLNPDIKNSESWFIYNFDPGTVHQDAFIIQNFTPNDETVVMYPADFIKSSDGGFGLKQRVEPRTGVGSWITFYPFDPPAATDEIIKSLYLGAAYNTLSIQDRCSVLLPPKDFSDRSIIEYLESAKDRSLTQSELEFINALSNWCAGVTDYELLLEKNTIRSIPFLISIPHDIDVGEHAGGILIQKKNTQALEPGSGIELTTRVGIRVYETVPGEVVKDVQLTGFSVKYDKQKKTYVTTVSIKNNGNTSQELNLTFRAHDSLFNKMNQTIDRTVTVLREDELIMNYEWQPPRFGRYVLSLEAQSAAGDEPQLEFISGSLVVWSIPWDAIMLFGIILLFIVIALCYSWYMKNKFASHNGWVEYQTKPSDTLVTIAQKNNISWRRLAQVNHIKKPYSIQSKQILLVPPMKNQNTTVNKQSKSGKSESTQNQKGSRKPGEDIMPIMKNGAKKPTSITANVIPQFEQPAIEQPKKSRHVWSIVVLIIFVAGVVVVFGVWLPTLNHPQVVENNQQVENNNNLVPVDNNADMQNTEAEIMEPEAPVVEEHEPVIQIIPSDISVVVQNGSGVPGAAGTLAQLLKENEYRVLSTENADRFDYTGTTLVFDEAHQDYAAYVEDFLNANKIETTQQVTPNAQAHITIILGR